MNDEYFPIDAAVCTSVYVRVRACVAYCVRTAGTYRHTLSEQRRGGKNSNDEQLIHANNTGHLVVLYIQGTCLYCMARIKIDKNKNDDENFLDFVCNLRL